MLASTLQNYFLLLKRSIEMVSFTGISNPRMS